VIDMAKTTLSIFSTLKKAQAGQNRVLKQSKGRLYPQIEKIKSGFRLFTE